MATRNAAEVPTLSAMRLGSTQSEPTLPAAPSPTAGNHGTLRSAGQRPDHGERRPRRPSPAAASGNSWAGSMPAAASASASQRRASWSKSPVPDAIETLVAVSLNRAGSRWSPNEPQWATRPTSPGRSRASQRSLAGQYEACR